MRSSLPRTVLLVAYAVILATQAIWWRGLMRYVDTTEISLGEGTSGYTLPVHYLLSVRDAVQGFDDVVVLSDGMDVLFDVEPARWAVMLRDKCVRTLPGDGFAVLPEGRFAAVTAPNAPANDLYQSEDAQVFPAMGGSYTVSTFETPPQWTEAEIIGLDLPVPFANGVTLTGYALREGRVYLQWSLSEDDDTDYQYFIHLLDDRGEVITQRDRSFWSGRHWCAGDRLISWQDMETTGATGLRVGFYTLGTGKDEGTYFPVDVLDTMGNPAGNWIDVAIE